MRLQFFRLLEMHQRIDETLRRELQRRWPAPFKVSELKKRKLRVKDRLFHLTPRFNNA